MTCKSERKTTNLNARNMDMLAGRRHMSPAPLVLQKRRHNVVDQIDIPSADLVLAGHSPCGPGVGCYDENE